MNDDLEVLACDPPRDAVRVRWGGEFVELATPPARPSAHEHLLVLRHHGSLTMVHGASELPPWDGLLADDVLLASVRMPAWTSAIPQSLIVDRRGQQ